MAIRDPEAWNGIREVLEAGKLVPAGQWCAVTALKRFPPAEQGGSWVDELMAAVGDGRLEFQPSATGGSVRLKPA